MTAAPRSDVSVATGEPPAIEVFVNAEPHNLRVATLADVLTVLGYGGQKVATALNGDFVPERMRAQTPVTTGNRVEILSARQGG